VVAHAPDAAHHRVQIGHFKGDVVQAGKPGAGKGGGMMRIVAAHEDHALGAVRHAEAQHLLDQKPAGLCIRRVEDDMGELDRHIAQGIGGVAVQRLDFGGAHQEAQQFALGQFDHDPFAAARIMADHGAGVQALVCGDLGDGGEALGRTDEGGGPHEAVRILAQSHQIGKVPDPRR
jgi:hypothetical protein